LKAVEALKHKAWEHQWFAEQILNENDLLLERNPEII
jgi:hypothetical protein